MWNIYKASSEKLERSDGFSMFDWTGETNIPFGHRFHGWNML